MHTGSSPSPNSSPKVTLATKAALGCIVVITWCSTAIWSHFRPIWVDELLEYYTDTKATVGQIIWGQLHAPFSLEPPAFHILSHWSHILVHPDKFAARLPSLIALPVIEICVFFLAWKLSQKQVISLLAAVIPFATVLVNYAPEARTYAVLSACVGIGLVCWYLAAQGSRFRNLALVGLIIALLFAVLTHYFAVFLLLTFWAAEITRLQRSRKLDIGILLVLCLGTIAVLLDIPFKNALAPFRPAYYSTGETAWSNIGETYYWFAAHFSPFTGEHRQLLIHLLFACFVVAALLGYTLREAIRDRHSSEAFGLIIGLCVLSLLPFTNLVVAQFTKAYVPRYSLPALIGLSVLAALAADRAFIRTPGQVILTVFLLLLGVDYVYGQAFQSRGAYAFIQKDLALSAEQRNALLSSPDPHIYIQDIGGYLLHYFYARPEVKPLLRGVYSLSCDRYWNHRDPSSRFAQNIGATTTVPEIAFNSLLQEQKPVFIVIYHDKGEEWIEPELIAEHATLQFLGPLMGGNLTKVTFPDHLPQTGVCATQPERNGSSL